MTIEQLLFLLNTEGIIGIQEDKNISDNDKRIIKEICYEIERSVGK